jgi:ribosomal 30S subunit maturation factor RimM
VGRPHGYDGSFYVNSPDSAFAVGTEISVAGIASTIERRAGMDDRPLVRAPGIDPREHRNETILVDEPLEEGEYTADQLVGAEVVGLGTVTRIVNGPSCDVLEVGDILVPLVEDAIVSIDPDRRVIEVDREFLGL